MEGFKKASFSDKILPDKVEILSETRRAWTCFFEYLELIFASFFYLFIFEISNHSCYVIGVESEEVVVYEILNWNQVVF